MLNAEDIEKILPHRAPFLFVDRVLELENGKRIVAAKKFTGDEDFFRGHFPGFAALPGVILTEAMAQTAGILAYVSEGTNYERHGASLLRLDKLYFRRIVVPGDEVTMEGEVRHRRGPAWKFYVRSRVGDEICAEGELIAIFTDKAGRPARDMK